MSNTKELKDYLLEKENAFLLNPDNNGKTIMLSGAWGAGKTYFWQNEIESKLSKELKDNDKACVYVSLYGKENIETLKNEILFKAYESIKEENGLKKRAISAFGGASRALSFSAFGFKLSTKELSEKLEAYDEEKKIEEAESFLVDGGVICLDDFERKSDKIDLNDLFGFISQLAIEMNCKIVIILNSDVFTGKEAEVFRNVKEKTVNKFFYFKPSIEELFKSISDDEKYNDLEAYKADILKAIKETKELNARIYIQVLDNCLEWCSRYREKGLRSLILNTICFVKNHFILSYWKFLPIRESNTNYQEKHISYDEINYSSQIKNFFINKFRVIEMQPRLSDSKNNKILTFFNDLNEHITGVKSNDQRTRLTSEMRNILLAEVNEKRDEIENILEFGYKLCVSNDIDEETYNEIAKFIKSGILI